jgi:error-prone DNA polymerase
MLRGGSHPEELVSTARELDCRAIAITDHSTLAGIVRAHSAAKHADIQYIVGCSLSLITEQTIPTNNPSATPNTITVLVYPTDRQSYGKLCRLLTTGKRRAPKGECFLTLQDFLEFQNNFACILVPNHTAPSNIADYNFLEACKIIKDNSANPATLSIAIIRDYTASNLRHIRTTIQTAGYLKLDLVATNDIHYHSFERKPLQDILTCIRNKCTIEQAGFLLSQNSERYLKSPAEMCRLFQDMPEAILRTVHIAEMVSGFSLDQLKYEYPDEICPQNKSALEYLIELTYAGLRERYPHGVPEKVTALIADELKLIHELSYEKYFLTCYDIVAFARKLGILCQGRGAAANSAVCYCLGITSVDPSRIDLLFARFVSKERNEPPDIDIDFEHERREEVIQYIYQKYGRERAGLTCEVVTYRHRSAVREVGKALGLSLEIVDKLAKSIHRWTGCGIPTEDIAAIGLDPKDPTLVRTVALSNELLGFPRHLSQHVGGFIISQLPLCETVPILNAAMEDRTIIEWDKDDIESLGMLKIDILALGMLTCIRKALDLINKRQIHEQTEPLQLHTIPAEDPIVYDMICQADTVGVFQIESRAQMSMLPRLKPRCFYDLVIEVAIVRPGPIQGNMVHPYLKRRNGLETITYPDKRVEDILGKTMGVPIFQEQAMRLAIVLAKFSPGEAEQLRRAMAAWKRDKGVIAKFRVRIIKGMTSNGYSEEFAESCMNQIKGFSEYGFPESHAASFALLVYASAWIKKHYPAEFSAALINSLPMGFYHPSQLISDAKNHGVEIKEIDINKSRWDCSMEYLPEKAEYAIRLGMRLVKGISEAQVEIITAAVNSLGFCKAVSTLWFRARNNKDRLRKSTLCLLAKADAFRSMMIDRRQAIWEIQALPPEPLPLEPVLNTEISEQIALPGMTAQQSMFQDYSATGFSLNGHPIGFIRDYLNEHMVSPAAALRVRKLSPHNSLVSVAGIAIVRQRPGTAHGVVFVTLEDETGIANLIIRPQVFDQYRPVIISSSTILAHGNLERVGEVVYISVNRLESLDGRVMPRQGVALPNRSYSY